MTFEQLDKRESHSLPTVLFFLKANLGSIMAKTVKRVGTGSNCLVLRVPL